MIRRKSGLVLMLKEENPASVNVLYPADDCLSAAAMQKDLRLPTGGPVYMPKEAFVCFQISMAGFMQ